MLRPSKRNRLTSPEISNRSQRDWSELPEEFTVMVLSRLGAIDVLTSAQKVCTLWRRLCKHPMVWRRIDMANDHFFHEVHFDLDKMCRRAVDRSFGKVEDINVEYFGTDDLLNYITDCSSEIKRLRLAHCPRVTDKGLSEVALKLTQLEDLDITSCKNISHESLRVIGRCCPLLKSFKLDTWFKLPRDEVYADTVFNIKEDAFNVKDDEDTDEEVEEAIAETNANGNGNRNVNANVEVDMDEDEDEAVEVEDEDADADADALAIAGSMHNLRHLQLFRNELTDDGLSKILDQCPHLESLDLRYCYNIDLKGDLATKCAERVKRLQLPDNSTDIPKTDLLKFTRKSHSKTRIVAFDTGVEADAYLCDNTIDFADDYEW